MKSQRLSLMFGFSLTVLVSPLADAEEEPPQQQLQQQTEKQTEQQEQQPKEDLTEMSLEDLMKIKVSIASFFDDRDLDVGSSISVINSETWKRQGVRRTLDAIADLPSTMVYQSLGGSQGVAIRGYASSVSSNRGIALLIDGVPVNNLLYQTGFYGKGNFNLGALEKIEMIRGPGSFLYGTDAFHGVISLVTPILEKDTVMVDAATGSFGAYDGAIKFSKALTNKLRFSGSLAANGQQDASVSYAYTDYATPRPIDAKQKRAYDGQTAVAKLNYSNAELGFYWNSWKAHGFPNVINTLPFVSGSQSGNVSTFSMVQLKNSWSLPAEIELETKLYHWDEFVELRYGTQPGVAENESEGATYTLPSGASLALPAGYNQRFDNLRQGFSLVAKRPAIGSPVRLAAGYSFDHYKVENATFHAMGTTPVKGGGVGQIRDVHALFVDTTTGFFKDRVRLLAGLRYDQYSQTLNHFSPRSGVIFQIDESSVLKVLYGHAFRAPSAAELTFSGKILGNANLKPEKINSYEIVYMKAKKDWRYDLTVFTSRWVNGIVNQLDSALGDGFTSQYRNLSSSESVGVEASGQSYLTRFLRLNGNLSHVRSSSVINGARVDYVAFPEYIVNWGLDYELPAQRLTFNLNNQYRLRQRTAQVTDLSYLSKAINNEISLPPYLRTDVGVTWDFDRDSGARQVTLNVRNVFNRKNYNPSIWNLEGGVPDEGIGAMAGFRSTF